MRNILQEVRRKISCEQAEKVLSEKVADPLGLDLENAANEIISMAADMIAEEINELINKTGKSAADFVLFTFGGNGAVLGCEIAQIAGIQKSYVFSLGAVLSAFGSSVADITHTYEYSPLVAVREHETLAGMAQEMVQEARRDMEGEGFDLAKLEAGLDFTLYDQRDPKNFIQFSSSSWKKADFEEKNINDLIRNSFVDAGKGSDSEDLIVEVMKLRARLPVAKVQPGKTQPGKENPSDAHKGERVIRGGGWDFFHNI